MGRDLPRSSKNSPWTLWLPWCMAQLQVERLLRNQLQQHLLRAADGGLPPAEAKWIDVGLTWTTQISIIDTEIFCWSIHAVLSGWFLFEVFYHLTCFVASVENHPTKYHPSISPSTLQFHEGCRSWRWAAGDPWVSAQGRWLFGSQKSLEVGGKPQSQWLTSDQGTNFQTVLQALWRFTSQYCLSFLPKSNQEADAEVGEAADLEDDFKMERVVMMLMLVDVVVVMVKHVLYGRHLGQIIVNYQSVSSYQLCTLSRRCRKKSL